MTDRNVEPDQVSELTGDEGGLWRVSTRDSAHYFDLERGTVTRVPGANAPPTVNDRARPLRTIAAIKVGHRGRWTMHTDGWDDEIDFFWANTSLIAAIERISRDDLPGAGGDLPG
ncbi:hypothetical protein [Cryobacterium sp. AP23]